MNECPKNKTKCIQLSSLPQLKFQHTIFINVAKNTK